MSFTDSFWTKDYETGIEVLFDQLRQGIKENEDFIQLFTKRMESELIYGNELEAIEKAMKKSKSSRNENEDYVSTIKNAFQEMNKNFTKQGECHLQIASNISHFVLEPFSKWSGEHEERVEYSYDAILRKSKAFRSAKTSLERLQKRYFNRCRMLEEFKSHYSDEELKEEMEDLKFSKGASSDNEGHEGDESMVVLGAHEYDHDSLKSLLAEMLHGIELTSRKVPILGTYHNVSTGSSITQWLLDNKPELEKNIINAEKLGQDLLSNGFIRLIGSMSNGKTFINSSQFYYQWRPEAFKISGVSELENLSNAEAISTMSGKGSNFSEMIIDMKQALGVPTTDFSDKSQLSSLMHDVSILDDQYYKATVDLDILRCELEETVMDHLAFMQKCELDRLKAIKKVIFDFIGSFSNRILSLKTIHEELILLEETINPINDLKFLIDNYGTGKFKPNVILYDNYYDSNIRQTFGVDLAIKCRLEKKVVPTLIQCILSHLDKVYPELKDDEDRVKLWNQPVHLSKVHQVRFELNEVTSSEVLNDILSKTDPKIVTNLLKLYLMELPDPIIPYDSYDIIKSLYQNYPAGTSDSNIDDSRINGLQNVLVELPKCNLATLDAILTHLNRLVQIIGSKNEQLAQSLRDNLAKEFGGLILRVKPEAWNADKSSYSKDKHQSLVIKDLFVFKDRIFNELKRRSSAAKRDINGGDSNGRKDEVARAPESRSRLESKLQRAVKQYKHKVYKQSTKASSPFSEKEEASKGDDEEGSRSHSTPKNESTDNIRKLEGSSPVSLKRSSSPIKKKNRQAVEEKSSSPSSESGAMEAQDSSKEDSPSPPVLPPKDMKKEKENSITAE